MVSFPGGSDDAQKSPAQVRLSRLLPVVLLFAIGLKGQQGPVVGLLDDEDIPLARRVLVAPIALYQQLSYATPLLNCQFEPSCSHFMALSISGHGVAQGVILGADRLVRCNPFAYGYQLRDRRSHFYHDGRLLDPVPATGAPWELRPGLTGAIIPGLGRARAGRPGDGVVSFLMVVSLAAAANKLHLDGKQTGAGIMGAFAIIFWLADLRSAGLSQAMESQLSIGADKNHAMLESRLMKFQEGGELKQGDWKPAVDSGGRRAFIPITRYPPFLGYL